MTTTYTDFVKAYVQEIQKLRPDFSPADAQNKVTLMLDSINKSARHDWLKYNPAMKKAAAKVGIKRSAVLRTFVKLHYGEPS